MKTEELTALGLSEDQATKILALHGKDITKLQNSVTALTTERDGFKTQLDTANTKLTGYDPEWKSKADTAAQDAKKQVDALKFDYALNDALKSQKARDTIAVKAHLKMDSLKLTDDGTILGLNEQLENVKKNNAFLFDSGEQPPFFSAPAQGPQTGSLTDKDKVNNAIRTAFNIRKDD